MSERWLPILALAVSGCAGNADDGGAPGEVERGPVQLAVDGDPNGLWWDAATETLYLADDDGNRILTWTDAGGFASAGALAAAPADGPGLGQVVRPPDGTLVVTRFGGGTAGDVATLAPDGTAGVVSGLDPERRRLGLTVGPDGALYDSWYVVDGAGVREGAIGKLDLSGAETPIVESLGKPVGVWATDGRLYFTDQEVGQLLSALPDGSDLQVVAADLPEPDLLCGGPGDTLFTGGANGEVRQISLSGEVTLFAPGFREVRGVAYDEKNTRLFLVDHDPDEADGLENFLQILPVDP